MSSGIVEIKNLIFSQGRTPNACTPSPFGRDRLFVAPWTVDCQAPLSMQISRQEHCSGLPFPSPGDLPDPEIEPESLTLQANSLPSQPPGKPQELPIPTIN